MIHGPSRLKRPTIALIAARVPTNGSPGSLNWWYSLRRLPVPGCNCSITGGSQATTNVAVAISNHRSG